MAAWQGSADDRGPYADQIAITLIIGNQPSRIAKWRTRTTIASLAPAISRNRRKQRQSTEDFRGEISNEENDSMLDAPALLPVFYRDARTAGFRPLRSRTSRRPWSSASMT